MRVVDVGQYFVTKDTGSLKQFRSVACREYILPRDDPASQPKGWIQGNMRIGPALEVTTSFQHFKHGIEIRIESVKKDNSHSWVRISYGTNKYVIDSIQDNTEIFADPQEEQVSQTSTSVVAAKSKSKSKPHPRVLVGTTTIPIHERRWIDIEPSKQNLASYDLSKKVIRSNWILQYKFHLRNHHSQIQNWSDDRWKACFWLQGEVRNKDISIALTIREQFSTSVRALQGHSGNNLIDPTIQDNVVIGTGIFPYLPRWMHIQSSFYHHQWIGTWRSKFEQKTNSVLLAGWSKRWKSQRPASRRGILGRYWSCDQRRINILSDTIECNYSSRDTSSLFHSKSWKIENWRSLVWKTILVSSTTTKDLIETRSQLD